MNESICRRGLFFAVSGLALMLFISFAVVLYVAFPRLDVQTTLAYKPLMLPALAVMAVWIGWGIALVLQVLYGRKTI